MKHKNSKRAQTEIMGLMIIVVIITLIVLFVVSVVYFKPKDDPLQSFIQKDLSTSIISAMLKTGSGCTKDTTMEDLLIDMVKAGGGSTIICKNSEKLSIIYKDNPDCQSIINGKNALDCGISQILKPLEERGQPYHFVVKVQNNAPYINQSYLSEEFARAKSMEVTPYTLPIYPTDQVLEIWLCMGGECPEI
ncbi:hypothetical protein J4434_06155 [Candidatus Woesearchaeota archaeon]|nr:hypothetical protein [Candidatus Woesearchaeota archaeon]